MKRWTAGFLLWLLLPYGAAAEPGADFMRQAIAFQQQFGQDVSAIYSFKSQSLPMTLNLFSIPGMSKAAADTVWQGALLSSKAVEVARHEQASDIVFYNPITDVAFLSHWVREADGIHMTALLATTGNMLRGESLLKYDGEPYWDYTIRHPQGDDEINFTLQAEQTATALRGLAKPEAMTQLMDAVKKDAPQPFTKGTTTHVRVAFARSYAAIIGLAEKVNKDPEGLRKETSEVAACLRDIKACDDRLPGGVTLTGVSDTRLLGAVMEKLGKPSEYYIFKSSGGAAVELYVFVSPLMPSIVIQGWNDKGRLSRVNAYDYDAIMAGAARQ